MFMKNPNFVLFILSIYLLFVLKLGPKFMEKRKAFELKSFMIVFNASLVVFSLWLASQVSLNLILFVFITLKTLSCNVSLIN